MNADTSLVLIIFVLTYAGVAIGRIPGLMLDRVGIALLGATALVVVKIVPLEQIHHAIDLPTILLLYSLMIISAQLRLGGFYTRVALRITHLSTRPLRLLALVMALSAVLSALLANDIICLAFTPVLIYSLLQASVNPVPFLLGLAVSSNIGSAATIIGNPQNMLIGQVGKLEFGRFMLWCAPPAFLALIGSFVVIAILYKNRLNLHNPIVDQGYDHGWSDFNQWQSLKGLLAVTGIIILFFTPIPRELSAIAVAGLILCSRKMESREIMGLVDWNLLVLFFALFIVIHGVTLAGLPMHMVAAFSEWGFDLHNLYILSAVSTVLSNAVSNVPATMLLVKFLDPEVPAQWYALAVSSTFAGNLITIGSIANLIVIEQARPFGIVIGFKEHARVGLPVTVVSFLLLMGWILLTRSL